MTLTETELTSLRRGRTIAVDVLGEYVVYATKANTPDHDHSLDSGEVQSATKPNTDSYKLIVSRRGLRARNDRVVGQEAAWLLRQRVEGAIVSERGRLLQRRQENFQSSARGVPVASQKLTADEVSYLKRAGLDIADPRLDDDYKGILTETQEAFAAHIEIPLREIAALVGVTEHELTLLLGQQSVWDASWIMSTPQRSLAKHGRDRTPLEYLAAGGDKEMVLDVLADGDGY